MEIKKEAELKTDAEKKRLKEEAKKKLPPEKRYYDVKMECLLPAILTYRILAESTSTSSRTD